MTTEVPQIQIIDESRCRREQQKQRDVYTQGEGTHSPGSCVSSAKARRQCRSSQSAKWGKHQKCRVANETIKPL